MFDSLSFDDVKLEPSFTFKRKHLDAIHTFKNIADYSNFKQKKLFNYFGIIINDLREPPIVIFSKDFFEPTIIMNEDPNINRTISKYDYFMEFAMQMSPLSGHKEKDDILAKIFRDSIPTLTEGEQYRQTHAQNAARGFSGAPVFEW